MNTLQKKALRQVIKELDEARNNTGRLNWKEEQANREGIRSSISTAITESMFWIEAVLEEKKP